MLDEPDVGSCCSWWWPRWPAAWSSPGTVHSVGPSWHMSYYSQWVYLLADSSFVFKVWKCFRLTQPFVLHSWHLSEMQCLWQGDSSHHMERGGERCQDSGWVSHSVQILIMMDGLRHWPSAGAAPLLKSTENSEETSSTWQHHTIVAHILVQHRVLLFCF